MTSGYLSMENTSNKSFEITGISCSSTRAEIHETKINNAVTRGIKAIRIVEFMKLSTKKIIHSN